MALVTFFEQPGCAGNARQKALLRRAGHWLDVRDLRSHAWTAAELLRFLQRLPVAEWFSRVAPRVASGEIDPARLGQEEALALLRADPLLIRRPLLQVGERCEVGFRPEVLEGWIGLSPAGAATSGSRAPSGSA